MKLETVYDFGEQVYVAVKVGGKWVVEGPYTVGMVMIRAADSPGVEGKIGFNYDPQQFTEVEYMVVERGIGSGRTYREEKMYATYELARVFVDAYNEALES